MHKKRKFIIVQDTSLNKTGMLKEYLIIKCLIAIFIDLFGRLQRKHEVFCSAAEIMITKSAEEQ